MLCWNSKQETALPADRAAEQLTALQFSVQRAYRKTLFYQEKMQQANVTPEDIVTLADIAKLPFTTEEELLQQYPFGLLTMPVSGVNRIRPVLRSEGRGLALGHTENEWQAAAQRMARLLVAAGVVRGMVALYTQPDSYGDILQAAAALLKITLLDGRGLSGAECCRVIRDFGVTVLLSTTDQAIDIAQAAQENGAGAAALGLQRLLFEQTDCSATVRRKLEALFAADSYIWYGSIELGMFGIAGECSERDGLHIQTDAFYPEIIDPESGAVLPAGSWGELVLTTLTAEAMPILRYRTGGLAFLQTMPCACGRTLIKMPQIAGWRNSR